MDSLKTVVDPSPLDAPRLSLLASVPVIHEEDSGPEGQRWRAGITWTPEPCGGEGGTFDPSCGGPTVDISGDKSTVKVPEVYVAFGVFEPESCSTFGWAGVDTDQRARRAITVDEAKQVENELWKGTRAQAAGNLDNRWLARNVAAPDGNPPAVTQLNGGAATAALRALADLEVAIAAGRSGGRCMIHATRRTVTYWIHEQVLYRSGNVLLTVCSDTIVVPGEGYDGSAPDGTLPAANNNSAWAYATGPIEIFRGAVEMVTPNSPELTSSNRRTSIAKREYSLEIDPCVYVGINVSHTPS